MPVPASEPLDILNARIGPEHLRHQVKLGRSPLPFHFDIEAVLFWTDGTTVEGCQIHTCICNDLQNAIQNTTLIFRRDDGDMPQGIGERKVILRIGMDEEKLCNVFIGRQIGRM